MQMFTTVKLPRYFGGVLAVIIGIILFEPKLALWGHDPRTITQISTAHKIIALTIDDGPHYKTTPEILAVLKEKNVHATFFVLGANVDERPDILAQEAAEGHEIAIHGYHHNSLVGISQLRIKEELSKTEEAIRKVLPLRPVLFRPPGGEYNDTVLTIAKEKGYSIVLWNIDPKDWTRPPVQAVRDNVLKAIAPGSIILLHDGQYPLPTPKALALIIDQLREQGYDFVTVSELLQLQNIRPTLFRHD